MTDHSVTLKKVGKVLIVVGLLDIAVMIYCISKGIPYSSSLNIFAVIGGLFLYAGSLKAARIVAFFSAFLLGAVCSMLVLMPIASPMPLDFIITLVRLYPLASIAYGVFILFMLTLLFWVFGQLTSPQIINAMEETGVKTRAIWKKPGYGLIIGICLPITILVLMAFSISKETRNHVISEASSKTGAGYKYFISSYNLTKSSGIQRIHATVIAYSDTEIKKVKVDLEE